MNDPANGALHAYTGTAAFSSIHVFAKFAPPPPIPVNRYCCVPPGARRRKFSAPTLVCVIVSRTLMLFTIIPTGMLSVDVTVPCTGSGSTTLLLYNTQPCVEVVGSFVTLNWYVQSGPQLLGTWLAT
jgi:hypothetical protein